MRVLILGCLLIFQAAGQHKEVAVDGKILEGYTGRYQMTPAMVMTVTLEGGRLFTQATGQTRVEIFPESDREFFVKAFDAQLSFHPDAQGMATEMVLHQRGADLTCKRIVQATAGGLSAQLAEIDALIAGEFGKRPVGSVTAGVVSGNQLIWTKSYGNADMEKSTPADQETIYRIGSITKMFTAVMLEQLAEAGKLHLSDPAEKYFPELKSVLGRFADAPPITLVQLATHTAGLSREPDDMAKYVAGPVAEWEKTLIAALPHTHYEFEPGTRYSYSNIGYAILGATLARAAGQPYIEYIPKRIFEPLGMTHSALELSPKMLPHLAKGYVVNQAGVDSETPQKEHQGRGYKMPNGAIYTTVGDMARFAAFLMGEGLETVLKTATLERSLMQSPVQANFELTSGYGLGIEMRRRENYVAFGHGGNVAGYEGALFMNRRTRVGVIILANVTGTVAPAPLALRALDVLSK